MGTPKSIEEKMLQDQYGYGIAVKLISISVCLIAFILAVTGIELTLAWNHVWDVYTILTAGQIVPLTAGVAVLFTALWDFYHGPLQHGGNYRRKMRKLRKARLSGNCVAPAETAIKQNGWVRIKSAVMTPSRPFKDYDGERRQMQEKTVLQKVVAQWRMLAATKRNGSQGESISLLLNARESVHGEGALPLAEERGSSSERM
ncbi:uncharacterized protein AB675_10431 [Cyphellophora attinorum]|uniref:Uncharacterized protein n=1 Tax=Cyphellophora attinorum TaxID=1664694 RepID=A0A0N0NIX0_9EURO|nr:uncharacterized protein AB675_10431 [Phialophora attinorum]KPI35939.1 hypothetical protein AB675_10431 [Phialophora attinorum]